MASAIENIIDAISDYLDSCKPAAFSANKIVVNRDEMDNLLDELRLKTPEEIKKYQKIINNQEAILADAHKKADAIIQQAQVQTTELVSEHQIMQQAYAQANEVVLVATKQAEEMLDKATRDANEIRTGAIAYTDQLLRNIQDVIVNSMDTTRSRTDKYLDTMQGYLDTVTSNRLELSPDPKATALESPAPQRTKRPSQAAQPGIQTVAEAKAQRAAANKPQGPNVQPPESAGAKKEEPAKKPSAQTGVIDLPEKFFNKE